MTLTDDFISELEQQISTIGTDECWKRKIGNVLVWFSPMPMTGQEKVNETLARDDLGPNVIVESKRVALSYSIVGINDIDLRPHRFSTPSFPMVDREKKRVLVSLDKYIYIKIANWGGQWVDDAFSVYSDLMDTYQKDNLKDIKFENVKDPRLELEEIEARRNELRKQLGIEDKKEDTKPELEAEEYVDPEKDLEDPAESENQEFNPFAKVKAELEADPLPFEAPKPVVERPDVLERPAAKLVNAPRPIIDPPQNINPRFKKVM